MNLLLRLTFSIAIAAPLISQIESPYFSLNSVRTFGSNEVPSVNLAGQYLGAVQMRVYRINNPVKFYAGLEDAHSFGSASPRPRGKRSWLETLHTWKRTLRRDIRLDLRNQFSDSPSAHFKNTGSQKQSTAAFTKETYFAQAPVLNQEQLVLSFIQPLSKRDGWEAVPVPIRVKQKGLYLVEAVHGNLRAYSIVTVSDLVMINKVGRTKVLSYLADRQSGEPVAGATVAQVEKHNPQVTQQSNPAGITEINVAVEAASPLRLIATHGQDIAFNEVSYYSNGGTERPWTGYIYTDRPVYRPGDPVRFRGILRKQAVVGYETPVSADAKVEITDPEGKTIYQQTLKTNSNGVIHDELTLNKSVALGNFFIQVHGGESLMSGNFEVQEYKKPEYEVHVTPAKSRVLQGETVKAVIDSRYYFGEPVEGGKVSYSIRRSRYWFPYWYEPGEEVEAEETEGGNDDAAGEELDQHTGVLDSDGKLTISVPTTVSDKKEDFSYRIEAGVTDKAGREISGTGWITATYGTFNIFAEPASYVAIPGSVTQVKVSARNYDNRPVASAAIQFQLATWNWRTQKASGPSTNTDVVTGEDGTATANVNIPPTGGEIRVLATANAGGRMVQETTYIWAPKDGVEWNFSNQRTLKIVTDKKTYKKGEKAKILVVTGKAGAAVLVSVEGRDLRSYQLLRAKGAAAEFEYNIKAEDEPGLFVNAEFVQDGALYQGQKRISVPPVDHKLTLAISTDKPTYLPQQIATYDIQATGPDGRPAANADLSLGVVDEAIYAIRHDQTPDILNFFYGREYNSVYTQSSLDYYFDGEAGVRRMQLSLLRNPSKLAQLKPEQLVKPKIRKIFPDTAFWQADLTTGPNGHVTAKVPFPDSLTTWRTTVRGVAPGDQFGGQTSKVIVRKNLILRLAVPRFFVQGDEVTISAIVHNYLQNGKSARVAVKLEGLELTEANATQQVDLPSRSEIKVDWRIKATQLAAAKITAEALTDEESDALEVSLPIHPAGIALHEGRSGSIADSGSQTVAVTFPETAVAASRSVSIKLSSSVAGSIFNALDFLTSFPYGCVEQTMSSFLPDLMVRKSIQELHLKQDVNDAALNTKIQAGLARLYSFQHEDGGWGWWQTDETSAFMSAYVVAGLAEARADGVSVDSKVIEKGRAWVRTALAGQGNLAPDLRAYMAYALAMYGKPEPLAMDKLYNNRSKLSSYGLALLGLALEQAKDARAGELAAELQRSVQENESEASWPSLRDEMLDFEADVSPEATAYAVKLLSHQAPKSPLLPKAALWLVNHRNEGEWWSSTKQTAMVIYGLLDYVKASNELHPDFSATISLNGKSAGQQEFRGDNPIVGKEIVIEDAGLQPSSNQIILKTEGKGRLYYSVSSTHYSKEPRLEKNGAISLNLLRDYFRLVPTRTGEKIVYDLQPLDGSVSPGDVIAVRLTLTGSSWRYLLLEDPIPAGTEFIEKDNLYEISNKPPWWQYDFSRRELHDDRMAIFDTFFYEQQKQYFYLLKVVNPGKFHVNPARVEPMYQPGHSATTEERMLEVAK